MMSASRLRSSKRLFCFYECVALCFAVSTIAAAGPPPPPLQFLVTPVVTVGGAKIVAAADLNRDGNADLVVATSSKAIGVLLGNGNGGFPLKSQYKLLSNRNATGIAIADMNNDHVPDIVVVTSESVQILLGKGDGSFLSPQIFYGGGVAITVGDFNGDGNLDVAIAMAQKNIGVFLGNGDGTLRSESIYAGNEATSIVCGDFNHDGKLDLALAVQGVHIFWGNGDGTFKSGTYYPDAGAVQLQVSDMNSDGFPDIVTVGNDGIAVLRNKGNGQFLVKKSTSAGLTGSFTVGDFNDDGRMDVAVSGLAIFLGKGDGTFRQPSAFFADGSTDNMVAVDINNDGRLDIVQPFTNYYAQGVELFFGKGNGTVRAPSEFSGTAPNPKLVAGDFDNDGKTDLASLNVVYVNGNPNGKVGILHGNGNGSFQPPAVIYDAPPASNLITGDFNNDGKLDMLLFTNQPTDQLTVFLGNGDDTLRPPVFTSLSFAGPDGMAVADFNRDGILDVAVTCSQCSPGTVTTLLGNGDGTFRYLSTVDVEDSPQPIVAADFNKDGIPDLAVGNWETGTISILLGNGDGTFKLFTTLSSPQFGEPTGLVVGDFNGDGNQDLAASGGGSFLSVALGDGDGHFESLQNESYFEGDMVAADLNGDGILDLVSTDGLVRLGDGNGNFEPKTLLSPAAAGSVQAAILGNDLLPDLIFGTNLSVPITVFVNQGK